MAAARWYHYVQTLSPQTLPYALFSPPAAYFINEIIQFVLAYSGARLLFELLQTPLKTARIMAAIFALSVSFSTLGLGFAAAPLVFWIALRATPPRWWMYVALALIGMSTNLVLHAIFLPVIGLALIWVFSRWDRLGQAVLVLGVFLVFSAIATSPLIITTLWGPPSQRVEMISDPAHLTLAMILAKILAHVLVLDGAAHAIVVPAIFAGPVVLAGLLSGNGQLRRMTWQVLLLLAIAGLFGALADPIKDLVPGPLKTVQFARIRLFTVIPLLALAGLLWQGARPGMARGLMRGALLVYGAMALLATAGINPDHLKAGVPQARMGALLAEVRKGRGLPLLSPKFYARYGISLASFRNNAETFSSFFRDEQYACLAEKLPVGRVMSVGLDPMIAPYHGIPAIDGYHNFYPLSYKHPFARVIEKQLPYSLRGPEYFYNWGSRLNTFVLSGDAFYLNLDAARALGATAVISAFPIAVLGNAPQICGSQNRDPIYIYLF